MIALGLDPCSGAGRLSSSIAGAAQEVAVSLHHEHELYTHSEEKLRESWRTPATSFYGSYKSELQTNNLAGQASKVT